MSVKQPGSDPWTDLFDPYLMGRVCDLVHGHVGAAAMGHPSGLHEPLRAYLLAPLQAYIKQHWRPSIRGVQGHIQAAEQLHEVADVLADLFEGRYPFTSADADRYRESLRQAWLEFMAMGSAHRMYDDLPRERAQRAEAAKKPRGRAAGITPQIVADRLKRAGVSVLSQELAAEIAREFKVGESTVYRRLKLAKDKGLLS